MSKTAKWILGIIIFLVVVVGLMMLSFVFWIFSDDNDNTTSTTGEKVAVVELKETIVSSEDIVRQFKKYGENHSVKAIVFRVESPGGGVAASQEIFEEVKQVRQSGKPVVVSMGSVAASGGYYVSCPATKIFANPGTLTGSIGVIIEFLHFKELMNKIGVDETTIKTGKFKDTGSPYRKATDDEKAYFQFVIGDVFNQFVDAVATERHMERDQVLKYADGRVFTGRQAREYGFVDTLGTYDDAIHYAAKLGGVSGKPNVVKEGKKKSFFDRVIGDAATEVTKLREQVLGQPMLQYRFSASK